MTEKSKPQLNSREDNLQSSRSVSVSHTELFSGPLPHPVILSQYNTVVPGAAERIITMAENQSAHRIALEKHVIEADIQSSKTGQLFGFIIALVGLVGSFTLIMQGHELIGTILGGTTLVSLVGVFVYGTSSRRAEREKKEAQSDQNLK